MIDILSDSFGWPSSEEGSVIYDSGLGEPKFIRTVTDSERSDVTALINSYDDRKDKPGEVSVMNNDGGVYRAVYYNKVYEVNEPIDTVTYEADRIQSRSQCEAKRRSCAFSWSVYVGIGVPFALYGCGTMGPAGCLIGGGLAGYSIYQQGKACRKVDRQCSNYSKRRSRRRRKRRKRRR